MKARLAEISWEKLRDAYGPATAVPKRILELTRTSKAAREQALEQLWMALCPQRASLTQASAPAVPFLVELASSNETRGRAGILELLQGMAELASRRTGPEAAATSSALQQQAPDLFLLLTAADADVRARASLVLAQLTDATLRERLERELSQRYPTEQSADTRTAFVAAAEQLPALVLLRAALADDAFAPRLAAALALLKQDDTTAYEVVQDALNDMERTRQRYGAAIRYRPLDFAGSAQAAGPRATNMILPALLKLLAQSSAYEAQDDLEPLLQVYFPSPAPTPSREQAAIAAVAADNRSYFGDLGNATAILGKYGLPPRPRPLREYAARGPAEYRELLPKLTRATISPEHLFQRILDNRSPDAVDAVDLIGNATDDVLHELQKLPKLEYLTIKSSVVSARGISALPAFKSLTLEDLTLDHTTASAIAKLSIQQLSLQDVTLDDVALAALGSNNTLKDFMLLTSPVRGVGFEGFSHSPLRLLVLGRDLGLSSQAFTAIARLPQLHALRVVASGVQEDWLAALADNRTLQELMLRQLTLTHPLQLPAALTALRLPVCTVPPQLLAALESLSQLKQLDLERVDLSAAHVRALTALTRLEALKLSESHIEASALAHLRRALPNTQLRVL